MLPSETLKFYIDPVTSRDGSHNKHFLAPSHTYQPGYVEEGPIYVYQRPMPTETALNIYCDRMIEVRYSVRKETESVFTLIDTLPNKESDRELGIALRPSERAGSSDVVVESSVKIVNLREMGVMLAKELNT